MNKTARAVALASPALYISAVTLFFRFTSYSLYAWHSEAGAGFLLLYAEFLPLFFLLSWADFQVGRPCATPVWALAPERVATVFAPHRFRFFSTYFGGASRYHCLRKSLPRHLFP